MDDKLLTKIGNLLRKAEKTDNEHEADAFMAAAQRLATQSSIDLAVARAHAAKKTVSSPPTMRTINIGKHGKRGLATYVKLFLGIAAANDVKCDIASNSTYVVAFGFAGDIDVCEALYASLVTQMVTASSAYLRKGDYKRETVWSDRQRRWVPLAGVTARMNFQDAFARRIRLRLEATKAEVKREVVEASESTALALRNKETEIWDYHKRMSRAKGSWGGYNTSYGHSEGARSAGDSAGRSARIGAQTALGGARTAIR